MSLKTVEKLISNIEENKTLFNEKIIREFPDTCRLAVSEVEGE